ncbi:MAG: GTPase [Candidatus Aenigmatarchaeota archaeon]
MKKEWGLVEKVIEEVDIVLEVCDARMPEITRNKKVENLVFKKRKKLILVFNKADLVSEVFIKGLKKMVEENVVFVSCRKRYGFARLRNLINEIKGNRKEIRIGVVGYPNTGKSSLINSLVGKKKALTSPIAGFTKGVQWIKGSGGLLFYDTPGVIPIDERDEVRKAVIGAVSPQNIKNLDIVAEKIIELFLPYKKSLIEKLYGINVVDENPREILELIGKKKNYFLKGGVVDVNRTSVKIINDWQKGKLVLE